MDNNFSPTTKKDDLIKFVVSPKLKTELQRLADQRDISLSALMRLLSSEYIRKQG